MFIEKTECKGDLAPTCINTGSHISSTRHSLFVKHKNRNTKPDCINVYLYVRYRDACCATFNGAVQSSSAPVACVQR